MKAVWVMTLALAAGCQAQESSGSEAVDSVVSRESVRFSQVELDRILGMSPLPEVPDDPTNQFYRNELAAKFGQALFFDKRLSKGGSTACATCHDPELSWSDGKPLSEGLVRLDRHSPSLLNTAYNRWFFWDGRADSLWAQALVPLEHPLEHGSTRLQIAHTLHDTPELRESYESIFGPMPDLSDGDRFPPFGRPVTERELVWIENLSRTRPDGEIAPEHKHRSSTGFIHPHQRAWDGMSPADQSSVTRIFVNVGKAIAAFERLLVAGSSPFDRFVDGLRTGDPQKLAALNTSAQRGLQLFVGRAQCHLCHQGPTLSDREFHDIGIQPSEVVQTPDPGRREGVAQVKENPFNGIGEWSDDPDGVGRQRIAFLPIHAHGAGVEFKTPSLRNVAATAPYMHQGQVATLEEVLDHYTTVSETPEMALMPPPLTQEERDDLIQFLESLTDTSVAESLTTAPSQGEGP